MLQPLCEAAQPALLARWVPGVGEGHVPAAAAGQQVPVPSKSVQ